MGFFLGGNDGPTKFSYFEYQALTLCLAGVTCLGLVAIEFAMKRFQVLPVLFPGMFSVRERRFFFFDIEVMDGRIASTLRGEVKTLIRMTLFLVLSYLWQHLVVETSQQVGRDFPSDQCRDQYDCFASDLHYTTLFTHKHEPVDCSKEAEFVKKMVVSCIRFVKPSGTHWLMHMAIGHSLTHMHLKGYEVLVWVAGNSRWFRRMIGVLVILSLGLFLGLFFGGVMLEFVSSWLSFVMSLSLPVFLHTVWRSGCILEDLWKQQAKHRHDSIEKHFKAALAALPVQESGNHDVHGDNNPTNDNETATPTSATGFKNLYKKMAVWSQSIRGCNDGNRRFNSI